ncbi:transposase [Streptomyces sp. NPDC003832]
MPSVAAHLTYATARGHAPIDRALYLGADWAADEERRLLTGVPDDIEFATKPQLASDEVYGRRGLRRTARTLGFDYVLAVRSDHRVGTAVGRLTAAELAARVAKRHWMRMRTGHSLKGDRHDDWAMLDIHSDDTPDDQAAGHSVVLVRRHRCTRELSFYRCHPACL